MAQLSLPPFVREILAALIEAGCAAYLVGGAVRDLLLNVKPRDYDIATSATPAEVTALAGSRSWRVVDNLGRAFGSVTVIVAGQAVEITSLRSEFYAAQRANGHRPSAVTFGKDLAADLERRDFTINALALDIKGTLYDYCGGQEDLAAGIVRPIGEARRRYREDGLRMLRACRFVAQLGFTYRQAEDILPAGFGQTGTPYYLKENFAFPAECLSAISLERVRAELEKMLTAPYAARGLMLFVATGLSDAACRVRSGGAARSVPLLPELRHLVGLKQNPRFHCYDVWEHTLLAIANAPPDLRVRWAVLLHDLGKGLSSIRRPNPRDGAPSDPGHEAASAAMAAAILERFNYPAKFSRLVVWLVARHMRFAPLLKADASAVKHWLRQEAATQNQGKFRTNSDFREAYSLLTALFLADLAATEAARNPELLAQGRALAEKVRRYARALPIATSDLALRGRDLAAYLAPKAIGPMLRYLLKRVQSGSLSNKKAALLKAALKKAERQKHSKEARDAR